VTSEPKWSGESSEEPTGLAGWFSRTNKKVLFGIIIVVVVVASLIVTQMQGALTYFVTVDELKVLGQDAYQDRVRVGGRVLEESVVRDAQNNLRFSIYHNNRADALSVHYKGAVPDIFREGGDVIVEGIWRSDGIFRATNLLAQHPPEFKIAEPGKPHKSVADRDFRDS